MSQLQIKIVEIPAHGYQPTVSEGQMSAALDYLTRWVARNEKFIGKGLDRTLFNQIAVLEGNLTRVVKEMQGKP